MFGMFGWNAKCMSLSATLLSKPKHDSDKDTIGRRQGRKYRRDFVKLYELVCSQSVRDVY